MLLSEQDEMMAKMMMELKKQKKKNAWKGNKMQRKQNMKQKSGPYKRQQLQLGEKKTVS